MSVYTNETEQLTIAGTGAMNDFTDAADVPWDPATVKTVTVEAGVTKIGANGFASLDGTVMVNGLAIGFQKMVVAATGELGQPSGYISPADPNAVQIADGNVYLGVSVATNADLTAATEMWRQADVEDVRKESDGTVTLTVPAPVEKGFMILKSKGASK